MESAGYSPQLTAEVRRQVPSVPMHVVGGNSTLEEAQVVFVGTQNHYDTGYQGRIADTLNILPQEGDVVLTEGESFGGSLGSSWIPEMAKVDVTMMGWENGGLYRRAGQIVDELQTNINMYNMIGRIGLGSLVKPLIDSLKQRINHGMKEFDQVVLTDRTRAMKGAVMNVLGKRLKTGGTAYVYAGAAHLTSEQLGGMGGVKHVVLGV